MPSLAPDTGSFALFTEVPDQGNKKKITITLLVLCTAPKVKWITKSFNEDDLVLFVRE